MLFTKPGIQSFLNYTQHLSTHPVAASASAPASVSASVSDTIPTENLTKPQKQKLYLHEMRAHEGS